MTTAQIDELHKLKGTNFSNLFSALSLTGVCVFFPGCNFQIVFVYAKVFRPQPPRRAPSGRARSGCRNPRRALGPGLERRSDGVDSELLGAARADACFPYCSPPH